MPERSPRPLAVFAPAQRAAILAGAAVVLLATGAAASPMAQLPPRPQPALQCPGNEFCTYTERNLARDGYRYQMMVQSGGADWNTEFWVSDARGQLLLAAHPMRSNAFLAVQSTTPNDPTPPVRVVSDYYTPTDPAYAPSGYVSTIYHYDPASHSLIAEEPVIMPPAPVEQLKQTLSGEGWTLVFPAE